MKRRTIIMIFFCLLIMLIGLKITANEESPFPIFLSSNDQIVIDGENNDWPAVIPAIIESDTQIFRGQREKATEFNGKIYSFFTKNDYYLFAEITDATPCMNNQVGNEIYQGDCIEIYLGFHEEKRDSYGPANFQFGIALNETEPQTWLWTKGKELEGYEIKVIKTATGTKVEARIPLTNFGIEQIHDGQVIWIDFALDNGKGELERSAQLCWFGNGESWQTPAVWSRAKITSDERELLKPVILTPQVFKTSNYHRVYIWNQGKPWSGKVTFGEQQIELDVDGGITIESLQPISQELVVNIDNNKLNKTIKIEKEKEVMKIEFPVKNIKVNQLGYGTNETKLLVLTDNENKLKTKEFKIVEVLTDEVVFKGKLTGAKKDLNTGDLNYYGDFTKFKKPGKYKVVIANFGESYAFDINEKLMSSLFYTTMRSYYLQRCGVAIDDKITGLKHQQCHLHDGQAILVNDNRVIRDVTGGWHDAGDYGKYIPTAGVTAAQLLILYEINPIPFKNYSLDIPESGNELPDLLDEIKYELNWMLKMQDEDGGVYHKVNTANFPGMALPEDDRATRFIYEKSTASTAIFAGTAAMAARIFANEDPGYAQKLNDAAIKAGNFLIENHGKVFWASSGNTGTYKTGSVDDELFWAFAELFRLTGETRYLELIDTQLLSNIEFSPIGWDNMMSLGVYALIKAEKTPVEIRTRLLKAVDAEAKAIADRVQKDGYNVSLRPDEYNWASNKNALANGVNLVIAYQFNAKTDYLKAAKAQLNYVLGINCLSKSFITGIGADYVRYPHHRLVVAAKQELPGLLVGGPNTNAEDNSYPKGLGPRGYVDRVEAYACNEYAIDYNVPLVFLAGYFMSFEQ